MRRMIGSPNAMERPITAIEVPTAYPTTPLASVGIIKAHALTTIAITAFTGTRLAPTRRHSRDPGTAPSRENANIIRDAEVTDAVPQNSCALTAMISMNSAHASLVASVQM